MVMAVGIIATESLIIKQFRYGLIDAGNAILRFPSRF